MFSFADEAAHTPHDEVWSFDFVTANGGLAGYARIILRPGDGRAWWWSAVVGEDRPYVLVREHDVDLPKPGSLEVRAAGLWAEPYCEAPFEHWSVGLEAFAVALDDPLDAYRGERGDPVPMGLDLGWEATSEPIADGATAYHQDCVVHGVVLVGRERLSVAGTGTRSPHAWAQGLPPYWSTDGAMVGANGLITAPEPVYHAPIQLPDGRLARAVCRLPPDGALAWVEAFQPADQPA